MDSATMEEVRFHSSKISGDDDAQRLEGDLGPLDGVRSVTVDTSQHTVSVRFDSSVIDRNAIQGVLDDDGYSIDEHAGETSP